MAKITLKSCHPAILLIKGYQTAISPLLGHHCRFYPSCSQYMLEAIHTYGIVRGVWLGIKRVLKCHPFCQGGCDPVPPIEKE